MQMLQSVLGEFYADMNAGLLVNRAVSNIDDERAKMDGRRIIVFNELEAGEKLKLEAVKQFTGGDKIPVRRLYQSAISITPRHLCILCTNHMPRLDVVDPAIVNRVIAIHFPVTFTTLEPGEQPSEFRREADITLKDRLRANLPGVLKFLVDGAVAYYRGRGAAGTERLIQHAPHKVTEFGKAYFEEQDRVGNFVAELCARGEDFSYPTEALRLAYNAANADARLDATRFAEAMRAKGFIKKHGRHALAPKGTKLFIGVKLRDGVTLDTIAAAAQLAAGGAPLGGADADQPDPLGD